MLHSLGDHATQPRPQAVERRVPGHFNTGRASKGRTKTLSRLISSTAASPKGTETEITTGYAGAHATHSTSATSMTNLVD